MLGPVAYPQWVNGLFLALPTALVSIGMVIVAFLALGARRPATRRHCLKVLDQLTAYVVALRGKR